MITAPSASSRLTKSASFSATLSAALILSITALGVPLGAYRPCQMLTLKPLRPISSSVGNLASAGVLTRLDVVTAKALTLPLSIWPVVLVVWSHIRSTWPPSKSFIAGAVPLYGTVVMSTLMVLWNSRPHRRDAAPRPALARLILPLLASIHLASSA